MKMNNDKEIKITRHISGEYVLFVLQVLEHYRDFGRHDLVWRKKITPYRILVSEIMLQQTQVMRVLPKFETWMEKFPSLKALALSDFKEVLVLWQGLGYQRRVKSLLVIAKENNTLPKSFDELCKLPGIGPYTASAICAFAYDTFSYPVLETNIRTALIDYFHQGEESVHDGVLYDDLTKLEACEEVKVLGARYWYYALMDFGAYLKSKGVSHNKKSAHYVVQSVYKGSHRELRAKTLFAIAHERALPQDRRLEDVLKELCKEGYISKSGSTYTLVSL
jgi:A/G-specific adenine glycosylase